MKKNKFLLFAAIAMAVLTSCGGGQKGLPTSNEYPVVTIGPANAQLKTTYPATIKGVQDVEVRPKISGFITKLYVHEGQAVSAGQVLFELDNATYQAAVRAAQAQINQAEQRTFSSGRHPDGQRLAQLGTGAGCHGAVDLQQQPKPL